MKRVRNLLSKFSLITICFNDYQKLSAGYQDASIYRSPLLENLVSNRQTLRPADIKIMDPAAGTYQFSTEIIC